MLAKHRAKASNEDSATTRTPYRSARAPNTGASNAPVMPYTVTPAEMLAKLQPNSSCSGPSTKPMVLNGNGDAPHMTPSMPATSTFQPDLNSLRTSLTPAGPR